MGKSKWFGNALLVLCAVVIAVAAPEASAQQNFGNLIRQVTEGNVGAIYLAFIFVCYAAGGIAVGVALFMILLRNERNADKFSWGKITTSAVVGGALLAIGFMISLARDTASDGGSSDQLPSFSHYQPVSESQQLA